MAHTKVAKVNPKSSHHKENVPYISSMQYLYEVREAHQAIVIIISGCVRQTVVLLALT